jgi:hypothetical protein
VEVQAVCMAPFKENASCILEGLNVVVGVAKHFSICVEPQQRQRALPSDVMPRRADIAQRQQLPTSGRVSCRCTLLVPPVPGSGMAAWQAPS